MQETRFRNLPSLKPDSGYSDLVIAGRFAYVAGKIAADRQSGFTLGNIEDETRQCMELIRDTLALESLRLGDIVKVNIFMKHLHEFDRMNSVYRSFFAGGREPARTTVGVADVLFGAASRSSASPGCRAPPNGTARPRRACCARSGL